MDGFSIVPKKTPGGNMAVSIAAWFGLVRLSSASENNKTLIIIAYL
jgi:hypothetical protein